MMNSGKDQPLYSDVGKEQSSTDQGLKHDKGVTDKLTSKSKCYSIPEFSNLEINNIDKNVSQSFNSININPNIAANKDVDAPINYRSKFCDPCLRDCNNRNIAVAQCEACGDVYCDEHIKVHKELHLNHQTHKIDHYDQQSMLTLSKSNTLSNLCTVTWRNDEAGVGKVDVELRQRKTKSCVARVRISMCSLSDAEETSFSYPSSATESNSRSSSRVSQRDQDRTEERALSDTPTFTLDDPAVTESPEHLRHSVSPTDIAMEGYLYQQTAGKFLKEYKKRYCKLYIDGQFTIRHGSNSVKYVQTDFSVQGAIAVPRNVPERGRSFIITEIEGGPKSSNEEKFYASSADERSRWIVAINSQSAQS